MPARTLPLLGLLSATLLSAALASAADPGFLLGLDYSQWLTPNVNNIATDSSGALYVLSNAALSGQLTPPSTVTKLSADGKTIVWQNQLGTAVSAMAVDPNGGVYVSPNLNPLAVALNPGLAVEKLKDDGSGIAWSLSTGVTFPNGALPTLAADSAGRVYVGGLGTFLRIAANGASVDYQQPLVGYMHSIVVDASGAAFVAGGYISDGILAKFGPDGTPIFNTAFADSQIDPTLVLDPSGNPVVHSRGILSHFDANGKLTSSKIVTPQGNAYNVMAIDQTGNLYLMGNTISAMGRSGTPLANFPVKNTLAACGSEFLEVLAPNGSMLQTTYLPGVPTITPPLITIAKSGSVLIAKLMGTPFTPTRTGPFPAGDPAVTRFLLNLSVTAPADTFPLACIGNAAGQQVGSVSPGELVSLFGNGLGPQQGAQPQATLQTPYPTQAGDVQVTFDGTPAPIQWAQDSQVNVVTPWSLNTSKNTEVCVSYSGVKLKCLSWPTAQAAPGVFTLDDIPPPTANNVYGAKYAIALNQDGSVNSASNPAAVGSLVSVFATGLGPISPAQADGSLINFPLPTNASSVTVDGLIFVGFHQTGPGFVPLEVTYAGPAPYRVAGISQINFRTAGAPIESYQLKLPTGVSQPFLVYQH